jgi:hypothetical protein
VWFWGTERGYGGGGEDQGVYVYVVQKVYTELGWYQQCIPRTLIWGSCKRSVNKSANKYWEIQGAGVYKVVICTWPCRS